MIKNVSLGVLMLMFGLSVISCSGSSEGDVVVEANEEVKDTIIDTVEERIALIDKYNTVIINDTLGQHRETAENCWLLMKIS